MGFNVIDDHELNWFDLETRMRKLVYDLLQPTVTRSHEDRELLYAVRKQQLNHQNRIDELEYALFKTNQPLTVFDKIYEKIGEIEQDRKMD